MSKVSVIGAGSWGTAFATVLARKGVPVTMWARRDACAGEINVARRNQDYLPDIELPLLIRATSSLPDAVEGADVVVLGIPSHCFREKVAEIAPLLSDDA